MVPFALVRTGGLDGEHHWQVYLPVVLVSLALMVPAIIYGEKRGELKRVFVFAVALMLAAQIAMAFSMEVFWGVVAALFAYFVAFNILEATLPSLISKVAPPEAKGTAMGVYNTSQALGLFFGGAVGGWLGQHMGFGAVFAFCAGLMAIWLLLAVRMAPPPRVKTQMFHVGRISAEQERLLLARLPLFAGIEAVTVLPEEGSVLLKVAQTGWDEAGVRQLLSDFSERE